MTRRALLATLPALPLLRSLDWVEVVEVHDGREVRRWLPRAVHDEGMRRYRIWERDFFRANGYPHFKGH